ncbi:hypothetical protein [Pectobacterium atrosepticum]|uniref:hypothetical protein n=1 Tax=Pectobacterium atrosepticum TaxID=29471 RepID=UPI00039BB109|nr:hypothetical protein [Pectobacterium atrosepticum]MBL0893301.1 hypothetical protein [Pectobacterium atrosepticum]MCA6977587.1 hypothetical protein [Pectobacterium atrosepticum]MCH5018786.1 hypothetical protein [Pectobacterium atrosepticum]QWC53050.1 hypothetical protein HLB43_21220 [Pectobacterium atrosepticum]
MLYQEMSDINHKGNILINKSSRNVIQGHLHAAVKRLYAIVHHINRANPPLIEINLGQMRGRYRLQSLASYAII